MVLVASHELGLVATKVSRQAGQFKAEQAWISKDAAFNFSSPVAVGKHLCGANWCHPAYVDGKLYLRDARELLCVNLLPSF